MQKKGLYVQAALLCEKLLQEKNGDISIIRITNSFNYTDVSSRSYSEDNISTNLLVSFRGESPAEEYTVRLELFNPDGEKINTYKQIFEPKNSLDGYDLIKNISFKPTGEGLYSLNIYLKEDFMTHIQFTVNYKKLNTNWKKYSKGNPYSSESNNSMY